MRDIRWRQPHHDHPSHDDHRQRKKPVNASRPVSVLRSERVAFALLLVALSTVFVGYDRGTFYRAWEHNAVSSNHLTVAANLSPDHDFLGFRGLGLSRDGEPSYEAYNRFPIGGNLVIKAALTWFADDLYAQIRAARVLMVAFFAAAAVAAYLSLLRLTANALGALAATLLGFSSFPVLYHSDMVASEGTIALFTVMLTFHGMVVFTQDRRFGQLAAKTCAALLLDWHVMGLLAPFIAFGFAGEWLRRRRNSASPPLWKSRHLLLGAIALALGASTLAINFSHEHAVLAAKKVVLEEDARLEQGVDLDPAPVLVLPSFESMVKRLGWHAQFNERNAEYLAWPKLAHTLFERSAAAFVPRCLNPMPRHPPWAWGVVAACAAFAASVFSRQRVLLASLVAAGFCWGVLVRGSFVFHEHEAQNLVGLPLVFFSLALAQVARLSKHLVGGCAIAAVLLFVVSTFETNRLRPVASDREAPFRAMLADFDAIRAIARPGARVLVPYVSDGYDSTVFSGAERSLDYYMAGRPLVRNLRTRGQTAGADFLLTRERVAHETALLTPRNREVFLYDRAAFHAQYAHLGEPALQGGSGWNVHAQGTRLIYTTGENCAARQGFAAEPRFFVEIRDAEGRPATGWSRGKPESLWFRFHDERFEIAGRCLAEVHLPAYADDIHTVQTGQLVQGAPSWSGEFALATATRPRSQAPIGAPG